MYEKSLHFSASFYLFWHGICKSTGYEAINFKKNQTLKNKTMKKMMIAVLLFAVSATTAMAETHEQREAAREKRMAQQVEVMKAALASQNFSFLPSQMDMAFRSPVQLYKLQFSPYFDVLPSYVSVNLPYSLQNTPPVSRIFDLYMPMCQPYTYSVKAGEGNIYYVMIGLRNASNQNATFMPLQTQNFNLNIHMTINVASGYTTMILTPDFAAPITYTGVTTAGN